MKIPPELVRRLPKNFRTLPLAKRAMIRLREDPGFSRTLVQVTFVLLCVWIGIEFHFFVQWALHGSSASPIARPPGVEGFLPISALMSLKYLFHTGIVTDIHPSGLFIFLAIAASSIVVKKSFCSWLCPIGTISESLWMLGQRLFSRNLALPRWLDYPLRSLKYLLLAFFVSAIAAMDTAALRTFIESPYNKVADVKMYLFFASITPFALWTILILAVLSVFIKNFWCRYLCPYGALIGIAGWLSPLKISRTKETCIDCALCTQACPSLISVHTAKRVWSDECTGCMSCVAVCPVRETLQMRASLAGKAAPPWLVALLVVASFTAITGAAMLAGRWQNSIPPEEYSRRVRNINAPIYQHFQGKVAPYRPGD